MGESEWLRGLGNTTTVHTYSTYADPTQLSSNSSGLNLNDLKVEITLQLQSGSFPNSNKLLPACTRPDLYSDFLSYLLALKVRGDKEYGSFHFILP